jgi:imidazolonepropionase-like amidohydrolase
MSSPLREDVTIRAGWLMDVPGEPLRRDCLVRVRDGNVDSIESAATASSPPVDRVLDYSDCCVLPGLIDCHVHCLYEVANRSVADFVTHSDADLALQGVHFTGKLLRAGFTTIRDMGNMLGSDAIYSLRDRIQRGELTGPQIFGVGAFISPTGGGGDMAGLRPDVCCVIKSSGICDGPDACRRAVREQIKRGADLIKVILTGSVLSTARSGLGVQFHEDELHAIVDTAHMMDRPVAVHAHGAAGVKTALRAGADSIEHASAMDEEAIELFSRSGAYLVPTLLAIQTVARRAQVEGYYPQAVRDKALLLSDSSQQNLRRAREAGIRIAFGTDSGVFSHGEGARELALMVEAGFRPQEAIAAATIHAARLLGIQSQTGTLQVGARADIIAVRGNPYENVRLLENVQFVMAGGKIHLDDRADARSGASPSSAP